MFGCAEKYTLQSTHCALGRSGLALSPEVWILNTRVQRGKAESHGGEKNHLLRKGIDMDGKTGKAFILSSKLK